MSAIRSHTFRGRRYRIHSGRPPRGFEGATGVCEAPWIPEKGIWVPENDGTLNGLETLIHEGIHASLWDLDEEAVTEAARDIARLPWRIGWRLCGKDCLMRQECKEV